MFSWIFEFSLLLKFFEGMYCLVFKGFGIEVIYEFVVDFVVLMIGMFKCKVECRLIDGVLKDLKK